MTTREVGTGTSGTRFVDKDWPNQTGLGVDDKHEGRQSNLVAEEADLRTEKELVGL